MPRKFRHGKLRYDSVQSVAAVHATPDAVSSTSGQDRACILVTVNRCRRHHSADSDTLVEHQWTKEVESSDRILVAEEVVR